VRVTSPEQAVEVVFQAILEGSLVRSEISARSVAGRIGQTTGFLYHHWGSLDLFLEEIAAGGWSLFLDAVRLPFIHAPAPLSSVCVAYVEFALMHPTLYWTMASRVLQVPKAPVSLGATDFYQLLESLDPQCSQVRARAVHASLHGLAVHALSGRVASEDSAGNNSSSQKIARELGTMFFEDRMGGPLEQSA
jgi:hypothetical protein